MIPLGILLTVLFVATVLFGSRRWAALGIMAAVCYITEGQMVDFLGFNFTAMRIVLLAGLVRVVLRGEMKELRLNVIDKVFLAFVVTIGSLYTLRLGTFDALVYQLGGAYNRLLAYFVFRCLFRNYEEVVEFLRGLAILILPLAGCMIFEAVTGRDVFASFGGVHEIASSRNEHFRAQGPFRIAITAGTFGATLVPLFVNSYFFRRYRTRAILAFAAAAIITATSYSSGPLLAFLSGFGALFLWRQRRRMRTLRWGIVAGIAGLALIMKAPVWFVIARVGELTGGHAWYRSALIEAAVRHFGSWWLMGTSNTAGWMPYHLGRYDHADITNQYLGAGVTGGIIAMFLFIWVIVRCFARLGLAMSRLREHSSDVEMLFWGMGCALFAHVVNFFSISYFDQMLVAWHLLLAVIAGTTAAVLGEEHSEAEQSEAEPGQHPFPPDPSEHFPASA